MKITNKPGSINNHLIPKEKLNSKTSGKAGISDIQSVNNTDLNGIETNDFLTGDLTVKLKSGEISSSDAINELVNRLVKSAGFDNNSEMHSFLMDQLCTDPNLRILVSQMGLNPDELIKVN